MPQISEATNTEDDAPIWRYMDLPKFVSMLANSGMWFTKASALKDDPYEGFCITRPIEIQPANPNDKPFKFKDAKGKTRSVPWGEALAIARRYSTTICQNAREHLYVNSWCLGSESMAMWHIYGALGCGIAIKSSVDLYRKAVKFNLPAAQYAFGKIKYHEDLISSRDILRDFNNESIPIGEELWREVLSLGFHKRSCYEYENEWRGAVYQDPQSVNGIYFGFDLEQLIGEVYIGPRAEKFLYDAVSAIMKLFLLEKPLRLSALLREPIKPGQILSPPGDPQ